MMWHISHRMTQICIQALQAVAQLRTTQTAANAAMSKFLSDSSATKNQIAFVRLIVEQLTHDGAMSNFRLYQSPFIDLAASGPESVFASAKVTELFAVIEEIRRRAVA